MLLILHDNDKNSNSFMSYLNRESISFISLTPLELINEISIQDCLEASKTECVWEYKNYKINFSNLTGLYNRLNYIDIKYFNDFIEEDRLYVQNEWWAYLVFRINDYYNAINPITREMMSGVIYQFPFIYTIANENQFNVPKYYISSSVEEIKDLANKLKRYIAKDTIYFDNNFRESNSVKIDTIGLIEYFDGNVIYVHIIDGDIWCTIYQGGQPYPYAIQESFKGQCCRLINKLNIRVAELVFKESNNLFILHYFSAFPNWLKACENHLTEIYHVLANKLISK